MPLGWATPIFDQAPWLDAASRCRILVARAMRKEPGLLVIDRAIDTLGERDQDAITAILADAGYNFRVLLNWLRPSLALVPQLRALTV